MDYTDIIKRLKDINLADGESSHTHLSAIAGAVLQPTYGWTSGACMNLRERLIAMASDAKACAEMEAYVERLHEAAASHEDVTVNGVDYMPYPTDGDGMQLHLGDEVSWTGFPDNRGEVKSLHVGKDGKWLAGIGAFGSVGVPIRYHVEDLHHYHKITVEDVLNELCTKAFHSREFGAHVSYKDVIAEYAAKLRLKEGQDD